MVRPKKFYGQHFLTDLILAEQIVNSLSDLQGYPMVVEIGPGTGILTKILLEYDFELLAVEIDNEASNFLLKNYPELKSNILNENFLTAQLDLKPGTALIGNFPYNISSQIFFKVLEQKDKYIEIVGMVQKEVGERITSPPGSKKYGILSVLLQAYYHANYLFTVPPEVFNPPPAVQSSVIQLKRNEKLKLECNEDLFKRIVKQGFQNRRKTLRNALKPLNLPQSLRIQPVFDKRAEQLSVDDFIELTNKIDVHWIE